MSRGTARLWGALERWQATAFLVAGGIFVVDTALVGFHMSAGTEPGPAGQALVGASWTFAFLGLLGFYPGLADRRRWFARIGAAFAVVGTITMAAMAVTSLGYATNAVGGQLADVVMLFLPPMFPGIVLGFGAFGVGCLLTESYSRSVGLLLLVLPATFLFNIGTGMAGYNPVAKVFGVVAVLALTKLAIGYLLWSGSAVVAAEGVDATSDASAG